MSVWQVNALQSFTKPTEAADSGDNSLRGFNESSLSHTLVIVDTDFKLQRLISSAIHADNTHIHADINPFTLLFHQLYETLNLHVSTKGCWSLTAVHQDESVFTSETLFTILNHVWIINHLVFFLSSPLWMHGLWNSWLILVSNQFFFFFNVFCYLFPHLIPKT